LTRRKIPNALSLAVLVIGAIKWLALWQLGWHLEAMFWAAVIAFIVFLLTAFLFWRGWMGGGDVKLLTATSFLVGANDTYPFLLLTSLIGGIVSLIVLALSLFSRYSKPQRVEVGEVMGGEAAAVQTRMSVPYGVAISIAALWILFRQSQ
jgi:prepilin peptidase CpaA